MIKIKNLHKAYDLGTYQLEVLKDINLEIEKQEFVTIMGPSGSGKSTLLHILGLLDNNFDGQYFIENYEAAHLSDLELSRIRNEHIGFVFQSFNLFNEFNAMENVCMPLLYAKTGKKQRIERARELIDQVGLTERMYHYPNMLSGGEQQRIAIARALANNPSILLADEPTGNLPLKTGNEILNLLQKLNDDGVTIIMVTHDEKIGACGKRLIKIEDGAIVDNTVIKKRFIPENIVTSAKADK